MDFMDFLNQVLGQSAQVSDEKKYEALKPLYNPSIAEVMDIASAVTHFISMGSFVAKHNAFCHEPNCEYNFGPARFADVELFLTMIRSRMSDLDVAEAGDVVHLWTTRDPSDIEQDPRYIAFRASHDILMVTVHATKASLNDPYRYKK